MSSVFCYAFSALSMLLNHLYQPTDEKGEGVVSSAVAVVIFSALGVAMWFAFRNTMDTATSMVTSQISQLGN
ncbi:MAG: hypothetical protein M0Z39_04690 [Actinomycetota bacterium]|jgi:hypothetical protein|nr:hypothetical protein [Actinomycetota bacterium]